jgi:hypothetical protein
MPFNPASTSDEQARKSDKHVITMFSAKMQEHQQCAGLHTPIFCDAAFQQLMKHVHVE